MSEFSQLDMACNHGIAAARSFKMLQFFAAKYKSDAKLIWAFMLGYRAQGEETAIRLEERKRK